MQNDNSKLKISKFKHPSLRVPKFRDEAISLNELEIKTQNSKVKSQNYRSKVKTFKILSY